MLLSASLTAPGAFYTRQASTALRGGSTRAGVTQLCRENQANIDRFVENLDEAAFDEAVALLREIPGVDEAAAQAALHEMEAAGAILATS